MSGAVYTALAVTIAALTVSTVTASFRTSEKRKQENAAGQDTGNELRLSDFSGSGLSAREFTFDTPVTEIPGGVNATVTDVPDTSDKPDTLDKEEEKPVEPEAEPEQTQTLTENGTEVPDERTPEEEQTPDRTVPTSEEPTDVSAETGFGGFIKPCSGYVSREYSVELPIFSPTMYDYRTHDGIDIACDIGTQVKAVSGGSIVSVTDDAMLGKVVVIEHADGVSSLYANLSPDLPQGIEVGKAVCAGDVIGGVGETALCESADVHHLHFEMMQDGKNVPPQMYITS